MMKTMIDDPVTALPELRKPEPAARPGPEPAADTAAQIPPSQNPIVQVNELNFFYGKNQALKNVTLDIPRHQVTALIGPSGCGKSTLLRCINRMNDLIDDVRTTGSIRVDGEEILDRGTD